MRVYETDLPGVGRRYAVEFPDGGRLTVLVGNDGTRETYWREDGDGDSDRLFSLTEGQARKLAEIYDGTYFEPTPEDVDDVLRDARIRWVEVSSDDPVIGRTIGEAGIRSRTGVLVLAVQRGDRTISSPDANTRIESGDVLVAVGTDDAHERLADLLG
ncbi:cation:proton antiporter regulatory subunit [Haloarcula nitratireducens]|uniref:Potassium transporter TrkA n=1 Tax=Haloarcula nitratireducens TaxID=2487749 RepID=A0AAW4PGD6_9EURY|nr:TrkA C-terminal domain-containing protein [Halomicroarcula nitratireducens]MBX0297152.1 potassium transporter TrkA [Halomicroarcula nitratireducens]